MLTYFFLLTTMSLQVLFKSHEFIYSFFTEEMHREALILSYYRRKENKPDTLTPTLPLQTLITAVLIPETFT